MIEQTGEIGDGSPCEKQKVWTLEKVDRLSSLPEPILAHILSFLPTKDAVKTTSLRAFGNIWTSVHNLDFHLLLPRALSRDQWDLRGFDFFDRVFLLHESPTTLKFSLTFQPGFINTYGTNNRSKPHPCVSLIQKVDTWIGLAASKKIKILNVDYLERDLIKSIYDYVLPDCVFKNDFLTEMSLRRCCIKPQGQIRWKSLMDLSLKEVMLSDTLMMEILSGCPILDSLSLIQCYGLENLNLTSSTHLKTLTIHFVFCDESRIAICAPHVKTLKLSGPIWRANLKIISSVVNAHIDFCCGGTSSNVEYQKAGMILEELKHVKFLTVCNWSVLVLSLPLNIGSPSLNRKGIVLRTMLTKYHFHGIAFSLLNSPCLESLTLYIEPGTSLLTSDDVMWLQALGIHGDNCWNNETWLRQYDFSGEDYWDSLQPFDCLTNHLRTVDLRGWIACNPHAISLVKYLLRYSNVLEKATILTKRNSESYQSNLLSSMQFNEFSQVLLNSPKASKNAVISFT